MLVPSSLGYAFARNRSAPVDKQLSVITPAFLAVYGGYNIFFGDIYNAADLVHSDVLCTYGWRTVLESRTLMGCAPSPHTHDGSV